MALRDWAALTGLLLRLSRPGSAEPDPAVTETRDLELGRAGRYDCYAPRSKSPRAAVVAVHGVTVHGGRDPRLVHFARSLARSRTVCYVPTLEGLSSCRLLAADVAELGTLALLARKQTGLRPGLVGFCHGASYALVLASQPEHASGIAFVTSFGAYHSLETLLDEYVAAAAQPLAVGRALDDRIYLNLMLARSYGDRLALAPEVRRGVDELLARYCHEATDEEKRAFYEQHLCIFGLERLAHDTEQPSLLRALSPAGRLGQIEAAVSIIHDAHDPMVPPGHAQRIFNELSGAAEARRHRLLITPLLSHVTLADALRLGDVAGLLRALEPVVRQGR